MVESVNDHPIRTFICIDFNDEVTKEVARIQGLIGKKIFTGKITELENLHLTLKFLGEIDDKKLAVVQERLGKIKSEIFTARLGKIGVFTTAGHPKIVWIKIEGNGIYRLQREIDENLSDLFKKEERFMSHLTIVRVKYAKDKKEFIDRIKKINVKNINFQVRGFKLNSSKLQMNGPVYKTIAEYKLQE